MRYLFKFCHTMGAIGLLGTMAGLLVVLALLPDPAEDIQTYAALTEVVDKLARWLLLPSLAITLVSGLLSMGSVPAYHSKGWAWAKLATGVLMFEGSLLAIQGPLQREAKLTRDYLAGTAEFTDMGNSLWAAGNSIWLLGGVAVVNVALATWRPRFSRRPSSAEVAEQQG